MNKVEYTSCKYKGDQIIQTNKIQLVEFPKYIGRIKPKRNSNYFVFKLKDLLSPPSLLYTYYCELLVDTKHSYFLHENLFKDYNKKEELNTYNGLIDSGESFRRLIESLNIDASKNWFVFYEV